MSRAVILPLMAMLALSACSAGPMGSSESSAVGPSGDPGQSRTDLAAQAACRQRANEMYEQRDRSRIYGANSTANTPYSANSSVGVPSQGLSGQFAYDETIAECERNTGTGAQLPDNSGVPPPRVR
jgi:hypothetical protein